MSPASPLAICRYGAEKWAGNAGAADAADDTPCTVTNAADR